MRPHPGPAVGLSTTRAPAVVAAAAKNETQMKGGPASGRPFRTQFDVRFELDLTSVSNSIRPFRTRFVHFELISSVSSGEVLDIPVTRIVRFQRG